LWKKEVQKIQEGDSNEMFYLSHHIGFSEKSFLPQKKRITCTNNAK
jgi:hypothetical protein